ncbi:MULTISPECIES: tetratricopeptide repeat protein [Corynebacterium]|uniref:Thioredoxin domain-containing protein n=1 Tax=Corynebacterium auriscanis TaxID=99807 RepID=A0A0A2DLS6_9CORY|nr:MULTISPECIES: tetratricopeptide repeat protein [Corynebacterium]KGM18732.1 hypothetical protein MA47_05335 [Corynebacterium auriscanis]OFT90722.1 hypothetical protein HMPREF3098_02345 [Corynebacterium sp. HMSC28B08]WJY73063.1 Thioredoxin [Corynebacterium auriscanis]
MTNPNTPPNRFISGAVDLGAVKAQADQRAKAQEQAANGEAVATTATVTVESFEADLVVRSTQAPVITLLGTARAETSEQLKKDLEELAAAQETQSEGVQWLFRYIDVDATPEIAQAFRVQAVPTVIALAAGRPLTQFEGGQPREQVEQFIAAVVSAVEGKLAGLPTAGDSSVLDADEESDDDSYSLAREKLAGREDDPVDGLVLKGRKAEAFEQLIETIRNTSGDEREAAKKHLLELFALFDTGDEEVISARTKMASALF